MNFDLNVILGYGITFGILIMTTIYTFVRYLYSKEITYISYSFMQFFSLCYVITYSNLFPIHENYLNGFLALAMISAIVFAITFYEGKFIPEVKDFKELIVATLSLYIVILSVFYQYILFEYLPYTLIYAILFISVVFNFRQGFNPTFIYVVGWSILSIVMVIFDLKEYYVSQGYIDIVLVAFAIEAIMFTVAVSYKYNILKNQSEDYKNMLLQQTKLAQSGEMIGNITHQFRQPLNNLSYILINITKRFQNQNLQEEYFNKKISIANEQIQFLSKTIDDFKEFYGPSKNKEEFSIVEAMESSVTILRGNLKNKNIDLNFSYKENLYTFGVKNELSQVLIALISNSIQILENKEEPKIDIDLSKKEEKILLTVSDNGGGVEPIHINKIFNSYFTTKQNGSGIGLYLAKQIVEISFLGEVSVKNSKDGAVFSILLNSTTS